MERPMLESEEALVRRAQAGDRVAFEELVRRTSRLLFARLYLETGDTRQAEADQKVGYWVELRNVAITPPREIIKLVMDVRDVDQAADDFVQLVRDRKGLVAIEPVVSRKPTGSSAAAVFVVPLSAKNELVPCRGR